MNHTCIVYGLNGAGSRLVVTVPDIIADVPETLVKPNTLKITYTFKTRKPKGPNTGIKPVNGNRLALRLN
jgi:hypothetical protein